MELLVVIAIIGILSSIVLANLNGSRQRARDAARVGDVKSVQLALELYFDNAGNYPSGTMSGNPPAGLQNALAPTYIATVPILPLSSDTYSYSSSGNTYQLSVPLEVSGSYTGTCGNASNYCVTPNQ